MKHGTVAAKNPDTHSNRGIEKVTALSTMGQELWLRVHATLYQSDITPLFLSLSLSHNLRPGIVSSQVVGGRASGEDDHCSIPCSLHNMDAHADHQKDSQRHYDPHAYLHCLDRSATHAAVIWNVGYVCIHCLHLGINGSVITPPCISI